MRSGRPPPNAEYRAVRDELMAGAGDVDWREQRRRMLAADLVEDLDISDEQED